MIWVLIIYQLVGLYLTDLVYAVRPEGVDKNWIKTKPGEAWLTLLRLYGPLEPILEKTWRWNDIERVKKHGPYPEHNIET